MYPFPPLLRPATQAMIRATCLTKALQDKLHKKLHRVTPPLHNFFFPFFSVLGGEGEGGGESLHINRNCANDASLN